MKSSRSCLSVLYLALFVIPISCEYAGDGLEGEFDERVGIQAYGAISPLKEKSLSGAKGSVSRFKLEVFGGASSVVIKIRPGSGDPDMYVSRDSEPTSEDYDCRPLKRGEKREVCSFSSSGTYYIMVRGYTQYSGWILKGMYEEGDVGGGSGVPGQCAEVAEFETGTLSCPSGQVIGRIEFASYGLPEGGCETGFSKGGCDASSTKSEVEASCLNKRSCTVAAENEVFGDPCPGNGKKLAVAFSCVTGDGDGDGGADRTAKIFVLAGQSNMEGRGSVEPAGTAGTLAYTIKRKSSDSLYSRLIDRNGDWVVRDDVWVEYPGLEQQVSAPLTVGQGVRKETIGPEYGFGFEMGESLQDDVIIIKAAWGGKSLAVDFRPPSSSGGTGPYYAELLRVVDDAIAKLLRSGRIVDGGYEIAGFGWHQGWNDAAEESYIEEYRDNLSSLIRDLRSEWGKPKLPVVIATSGQGGDNPPDSWFDDVVNRIRPAQLAVARDSEFRATVRAVDTIPFWRELSESPSDQGYHWNCNAESYYLIGVSMGQAMRDLL